MSNRYEHQIALTVEQVAEVLGGLSKSYIYRIIRERKLPAKKIGGRVLVSKKALEEFFENADNLVEADEDEEEDTLNVTGLFSRR